MAAVNVASNLSVRRRTPAPPRARAGRPKPPKQKGGGYRFGPNPLDTTPGFRDAQSPPKATSPNPGPGNTTGQGMNEGPARRILGIAAPAAGRVGSAPVARPSSPATPTPRPFVAVPKPPVAARPKPKAKAKPRPKAKPKPRYIARRVTVKLKPVVYAKPKPKPVRPVNRRIL